MIVSFLTTPTAYLSLVVCGSLLTTAINKTAPQTSLEQCREPQIHPLSLNLASLCPNHHSRKMDGNLMTIACLLTGIATSTRDKLETMLCSFIKVTVVKQDAPLSGIHPRKVMSTADPVAVITVPIKTSAISEIEREGNDTIEDFE